MDTATAVRTATLLATLEVLCEAIEDDANREYAKDVFAELNDLLWPTIAGKPDKKVSARLKVRNAVARGDLVRPKACSDCDGKGPIDAHHPDYDRPLHVEWLCRKCHGRRHTHGTEAAAVGAAAGEAVDWDAVKARHAG